MLDDKQATKQDETKSGRTVYSRPRAAGEAAGRGNGLRAAPMLVPLLVGFALLLMLIFGIGVLSVRRLNDVSADVLDLQRQRGSQLNFLLNLQSAVSDLNNEARQRSDMESRGGIIPPIAVRLRTARARVNDLLPRLESLPIVRTDAGRALAADLRSFMEITESSERYQLEGFERFRVLEANLRALLQEAGRGQSEVTRLTEELQSEAARRIYFLTMIAALVGAIVAAASVFEVQRRFRQVRRSLREVERERQFSTQLLGGMVSAVAAIDARGSLRSANTVFFNIFPEALIGKSIYDDFAPAQAMKMLVNVAASPVEESTYRGRWLLDETTNGEARNFDLYASPLDIDGERGVIVTLVDVSEAVKSERESRRRESLAAVGQAAAQLAHEIKNPLGSIRLGVSMLHDITPEGEAQKIIDLVERGIDHLNKLTVDVTQFSLEKPLTFADVDLRELLESSLDLVRDKIDEKRIEVETRWSTESLRGRLDVDQLRQVFVNLVANAVDASPEGASVTISTEHLFAARDKGEDEASRRNGHGGAMARISFADQGIGMDADTQARIFEPFFTTKKRGTGLGLAISKKIIERHGGQIRVESAPGEGTRFIIDLPLDGSDK